MRVIFTFKLIIIFMFRVIAQNPSCSDADFESFSLGPLPLSAIAWTVGEASNSGGNTLMCPTVAVTFSTPAVNNNAIVVQTPLVDAIINTIPNSPLGGNKVLLLNRNFASSIRASSVRNQFMVSAGAPIYKYAFITALQAGEPCCAGVTTIFRFYDCSGNLLSALSKTYTANSSTCIITPTQSCVWSQGIQWTSVPTTPVTHFNVGWTVDVVNLSPYVGSCVTVEAISSNCTGAAHQGYLYYDATCSADILFPGSAPAASHFTSCTGTALLAGPPCFSGYLWQGPSSSTVNGFTTQTVNTAVSGIYTLAVTQGSISLTQTLAVNISTAITTVSLNASSLAGCPGTTFQLQASGGSANSYTWNTGAKTSSISVTPASTGIYWVTTSDPNGCTATDTKTIIIHPQPFVQIASSPSACPGGTVSLSASPLSWSSYTWSNGDNNNTTTFTLSSTNVFSLSVTNANGCTAKASKTITPIAIPPINITPSSTVCPYQSVNLYVSGSALVSYSWSTGVKTQFSLVSPTVTTIYSVTVTDTLDCTTVKTTQVFVDPCLNNDELMTAGDGISIFPNPSYDHVKIKSNKVIQCSIFTVQGTYLASFTLNKDNNYTFQFLRPGAGVYYLVAGNIRRSIVFK